jgi:uncharacterized protein RhaS with RHS repeats
LYHTDYREYHGSLGRWTSQDPIGTAGGPNLYVYCGGRPADTVDPSGLLDLDKIERGVTGIFQGYVEVMSASSTGLANAMLAKGCGSP